MKRTGVRSLRSAVPLHTRRPIRGGQWTTRADEAAADATPQVTRDDDGDDDAAGGGANASGC